MLLFNFYDGPKDKMYFCLWINFDLTKKSVSLKSNRYSRLIFFCSSGALFFPLFWYLSNKKWRKGQKKKNRYFYSDNKTDRQEKQRTRRLERITRSLLTEAVIKNETQSQGLLLLASSCVNESSTLNILGSHI